VIKEDVAVRGRGRLLELIGVSEERSESGNSAGPDLERLEVISVSSDSENSSMKTRATR